MSKIQILAPEVIAKIAAGEVIERPSSVVKELLENSLDAGATALEIYLKGAGKTAIRIKDNGSGIPRADLETICSRHATSKIEKIDDLYAIGSLGFRGEALYSISAVSDLTIRSKPAEQAEGWELHVRGEKKFPLKPVPLPTGTEIIVQELFFNTPARKKFLKSNTAELNHILDLVIPYTLRVPGARFVLNHETRKLLDLAPAQDRVQRIADCLHLDKKHILSDQREFPEDTIAIELIIGDINIQRSRKDMQFVFINNRPVQERTVSFHMNEIFRLLFSPGVYPFFCVFITMPASEVDVNVHPAKREVKVRDSLRLVQLLRPFCEQLLMTKSKARQADLPVPGQVRNGGVRYAGTGSAVSGGKPDSPFKHALEESLALFKEDLIEEKKGDLKEKLRQAGYLGNLLRKYLLFETNDSLLVIDQHAAQERISFEKLKGQMEKGAVEVQGLLAPVTFKISAQELLVWEEAQEKFEALGFTTSLFDKETLAIHSYPQLISDPETAVRNFLAGESIARCDIEALARRACRSSVMAGFAMNKEQAEYQRRALLECQDPFTCPHGRPTTIEIPEPTLAKHFLRT